MKKCLFLLGMVPVITFAFQCPNFNDFRQDKNGVWELLKMPEAPMRTQWGAVHQGPWGYKNHKLDSFDIALTYGKVRDRVHCFYGRNKNYFLGVDLIMLDDQKPVPLAGAHFNGEIPNECELEPELCQFGLDPADKPRDEGAINAA